MKWASVGGWMDERWVAIRLCKQTDGLLSSLLCSPTQIRLLLTWSSEVKGGSLHYSPRYLVSSCQHTQHPSSHPSPPLEPLITHLSCHHIHIPLSHCLLIDGATFDNGIRNWGVCLVIRCYQTCLITVEEDPGQRDGLHSVQTWPQIMKLCRGVL